jgi:hypothetical protein
MWYSPHDVSLLGMSLRYTDMTTYVVSNRVQCPESIILSTGRKTHQWPKVGPYSHRLVEHGVPTLAHLESKSEN